MPPFVALQQQNVKYREGDNDDDDYYDDYDEYYDAPNYIQKAR